MKRVVLIAGVVLVGCLAVAWSTRSSWAPGILVLAPYPRGFPEQPLPEGARRLAVTRKDAIVRSWVFDPKTSPRGTVLLLHGIRSSKRELVSRARNYAARGFRAVAVDSRGHGESSGRYLSYGVEEARDLAAIVDELERRNHLVEPLAVVGTSYGAATALHYAAIDPRVDKVVALAPFASLRRVVRAYLHWQLGWLAAWVPSSVVDPLIDDAARMAAFAPDQACPLCVAPLIDAPVLLIHSRDDERIPWRHSEEIHRALRSPSKLMLVDGIGHVRVGGAPGVAQAIERWLEGS